MSQANAAAIRRRVNPVNNAPGNSQQPQQSSNAAVATDSNNVNSGGLTLPQVIAVIDRRLINLETFMKESKTQPLQQTATVSAAPDSLNELMEEYNHRFEIFADEIANMKDIVLKLQSYTMDVNKALMDERIHVFSDLGVSSSDAQPKSDNSGEDALEEEGSLPSMDLRNLVQEELLNDV
jgi:hypothetical protein